MKTTSPREGPRAAPLASWGVLPLLATVGCGRADTCARHGIALGARRLAERGGAMRRRAMTGSMSTSRGAWPWILVGAWAAAAGTGCTRPAVSPDATLEMIPAPDGASGLRVLAALARPDGSTDLVLRERDLPEWGRLWLWRGSAPSEPPAPVNTPLPDPPRYFVGDPDSDGFDDLLIVGSEHVSALRGPINPDASSAPIVLRRASDFDSVSSTLVDDLDGDGVVDWLFSIRGREWTGLAVYRSPGSEEPVDADRPDAIIAVPLESGASTGDPFLGDLNGDGHVDLVVHPHGRGPIWMYAGPLALDGSDEPATLVEQWWDEPDDGIVRAETWALDDVTGDGVADLVTSHGGWKGPRKLYRAGGSAVWSGPIAGALPRAPDHWSIGQEHSEFWQLVALADLDGDGIEDHILRTAELGDVLDKACGERWIGGVLAWVPGGFDGERIIDDDSVLLRGSEETGPLGDVHVVAGMEGDPDALAVSFPDQGSAFGCVRHSSSSFSFGVMDQGPGAVGLLRLR